ncbi:MAG: T9SS type A sorting domain-containing protein, partial [Bacteroidota bacterium]
SSVVGEETGNIAMGADIGALPNPPWSSEGNVFYSLNSTNELECIISTVSCGEPNTSVYDFSFTVNVLPEETEVLGLEGDGNPLGGCTALNGDDVIIDFSFLPVEWLSFEGEQRGSEIWLTWETSEEEDNWGFQVERFSEHGGWKPLGFISGQGNYSGRSVYEFVDEQPNNGNNIYRIRQEDHDGNITYSSLVQVEVKRIDGMISVYPNPFNSWLMVDLPSEEPAEATLISVEGRKLSQWTLTIDRIQMEYLPKGIYWLEVTQGDHIWIEKIVK